MCPAIYDLGHVFRCCFASLCCLSDVGFWKGSSIEPLLIRYTIEVGVVEMDHPQSSDHKRVTSRKWNKIGLKLLLNNVRIGNLAQGIQWYPHVWPLAWPLMGVLGCRKISGHIRTDMKRGQNIGSYCYYETHYRAIRCSGVEIWPGWCNPSAWIMMHVIPLLCIEDQISDLAFGAILWHLFLLVHFILSYLFFLFLAWSSTGSGGNCPTVSLHHLAEGVRRLHRRWTNLLGWSLDLLHLKWTLGTTALLDIATLLLS